MPRIPENLEYGCLRGLKEEDAPFMLEWMHDDSIAEVFQYDFRSLEQEDALRFINNSHIESDSLHFAVSKDGEYMGTVSLKDISTTNSSAEYAISMRSCSHGTGLSKQATIDVLRYAFDVLKLHRVFLNVRTDNERAIRFYEKFGFVYEGMSRDGIVCNGEFCNLKWFSILDEEFFNAY